MDLAVTAEAAADNSDGAQRGVLANVVLVNDCAAKVIIHRREANRQRQRPQAIRVGLTLRRPHLPAHLARVAERIVDARGHILKAAVEASVPIRIEGHATVCLRDALLIKRTNEQQRGAGWEERRTEGGKIVE